MWLTEHFIQCFIRWKHHNRIAQGAFYIFTAQDILMKNLVFWVSGEATIPHFLCLLAFVNFIGIVSFIYFKILFIESKLPRCHSPQSSQGPYGFASRLLQVYYKLDEKLCIQIDRDIHSSSLKQLPGLSSCSPFEKQQLCLSTTSEMEWGGIRFTVQ